jgi:aspartate aminotransferase-like enzyme
MDLTRLAAAAAVSLATLAASPASAEPLKTHPACYEAYASCTVVITSPMTLAELVDKLKKLEIVDSIASTPQSIIKRNEWDVDSSVNPEDLIIHGIQVRL